MYVCMYYVMYEAQKKTFTKFQISMFVMQISIKFLPTVTRYILLN